MLAPASHSADSHRADDSHRAGGLTSCSSADSHRAVERSKHDGGTKLGGVKQPTRNQELRGQALKARRDFREAKKFRRCREDADRLHPWQKIQVRKLELGKLEKEMMEANARYGHGVGAPKGLTRGQAMTMDYLYGVPPWRQTPSVRGSPQRRSTSRCSSSTPPWRLSPSVRGSPRRRSRSRCSFVTLE